MSSNSGISEVILCRLTIFSSESLPLLAWHCHWRRAGAAIAISQVTGSDLFVCLNFHMF